MSKLLILAGLPIAHLEATRGAETGNLLRSDPREVWRDEASGSPVQLRLDMGSVQVIDTIFLGHADPLPAGATWSIRGGVAGYEEMVIAAPSQMRVIDPISSASRSGSHALWHSDPVAVRYLVIEMVQPAGAAPISAGSLMVGQAFSPQFNQEWGAGRGVTDTGRATRLAGGGFAIVEGVRRGSYSWSFGDLSDDETDALYDIQLQCGETRPVLVIEDPARSVGQLHRIHYGRFASLKPYKRRNPAQTRWELEVEEW